MKIAVLSDVHGNYVALERCLETAVSCGAKTFIFLGDYIGELAYPQRTMELLYKLKEKYRCWFVRGNKEEYWLNYRAGGAKGWKDKDSTTGSMLYAYQSLTGRDLDFFGQMPISCVCTPEGMPPVTACHGSPFRVNEKMRPADRRTQQIMECAGTGLILWGHMHVQEKIIHNGVCTLNPGAVGMSLYSAGKSQFLILTGTDGEWSEEFFSLDYDVERVIGDMKKEQLFKHAPYWSLITEKVLRGGRISHGQVLGRAMELCAQERGGCSWPDIPEEYYERALSELR